MRKNIYNKKWSAILTAAVVACTGMPVQTMAEETTTAAQIQEEQPAETPAAAETAPVEYDASGIAYSADGTLLFKVPEITTDSDAAVWGYSSDSYEITCPGELAWFMQNYDDPQLTTINAHLSDDIDLSELTAQGFLWSPIGYYNSDETGESYDGLFNGNGYTISNLNIGTKNPDEQDSAIPALFGYLGSPARVEDLGIAGADITAGAYGAAGIAGMNYGVIEGCMVIDSTLSSIASSAAVGDIAYDNRGSINACFVSAKVENTDTSQGRATVNYAPGTFLNEGMLNNIAVREPELAQDGTQTMEEALGGVTLYSDAELASGSAAWQLNNNAGAQIFGQTIGTDAHPLYGHGAFTTSDGTPKASNYVYRVTLHHSDEATPDEYIYTNETQLMNIVADGAWQYTAADGTLTDATPDMAVNQDITLNQKAEESVTETTTAAPTQPEQTTPAPTTPEPTTEAPTTPPQPVIPEYTAPTGLTGMAGSPLATIALPADAAGCFVWQTDPNTIMKGDTMQVQLIYQPADTSKYLTVNDINVNIAVTKLDAAPQTEPADSLQIAKGLTLASLALPEGWSWLDKTITPADGQKYTAVYTAADPEIYNQISKLVTVSIRRIDKDAQISEDGKNADGWYSKNVTITAPEGCYISTDNTAEGFTETQLVIKDEGESTVTYYLKDSETGEISEAKTAELKIDKTLPVISGAQEGGVYDSDVTLTITDDNLTTVTVNGQPAALGEDGTLIIKSADTAQSIVATDAAGNQSGLLITVNDTPAEDDTIADAQIEDAQPQNGLYSFSTLKLTAPDGYYISKDSSKESFTDTQLELTLSEGSNTVEYYLMSKDGRRISTKKSLTINCDAQAPVISGAEGGQTYSQPVTITVTDNNLDTVTLNDEPFTSGTTIDKNGEYTLEARDKAGNFSLISFNIKLQPVTDESIPDIQVSSDKVITEGYVNADKVTLQAPEGYVIELEEEISTLSAAQKLEVALSEGSNIIAYHVSNLAGTRISSLRKLSIYRDSKAPVISGAQEGGVYDSPVTLTITDDSLKTVTVDGQPADLGEGGTLVIEPKKAVQSIVATDKAGNQSGLSLTVDDSPKTDETIPDASVSGAQPGAGGYYPSTALKLTAPEGYLISRDSSEAGFSASELALNLNEGENTVEYYLMSTDHKRISAKKSITIGCDTQVPVIDGLTQGGVYCVSREFTVKDDTLDLQSSLIPQSVSALGEGRFAIAAADGSQTLTFTDKAGNSVSVTVTVNRTHTYTAGICTVCGDVDPTYVGDASASLADTNKGQDGWYRSDVTIQAPDGYYISFADTPESFGTSTTLNVHDEGIQQLNYYLQNSRTKAISEAKPIEVKIDRTAPVITGAENGKAYCQAQQLVINDAALKSVTINSQPAQIAEGNRVTVQPGTGAQTITAADAAGNESSISITVNNGHSFTDGICTVCGAADPDYTVNVNAQVQAEVTGNNGWIRSNAVLTAPTGFYISTGDSADSFAANTSITISTEGIQTITYYLQNIQTKAVCKAKTVSLKIDKTAPQVTGIVNGKMYCLPNGVAAQISDAYLESVKVDNNPVVLINGGYTFTQAGTHTLIAADQAGNTTTVQITINADHTFDEGVITKQPTADQTGIKEYTCKVCQEKKTEELAALNAGTVPTTTLAMPSNQASNTILGIEDPSSVIGIVLIVLGTVCAVGVIALIAYILKNRKDR